MAKTTHAVLTGPHSDARLRLAPAVIAIHDPVLDQSAEDFERDFLERVLAIDSCDETALAILGCVYTERAEYEKGLEMDQRLVRLRPNDATAFYNLACSYSRLERLDEAFVALERALSLGFDNLVEMDEDPDLENLRETPRYASLRRRVAPTS